jgi:hypothetical protein
MSASSDGPNSARDDDPDDLLEGCKEIAEFIRKPERTAYYWCASAQLPAFKMGGKWHMRKSRWRRHVEELEDAAVDRRDEIVAARRAARAR